MNNLRWQIYRDDGNDENIEPFDALRCPVCGNTEYLGFIRDGANCGCPNCKAKLMPPEEMKEKEHDGV